MKKINKESYEDFLDGLQNLDKPACYITKICDVERANFKTIIEISERLEAAKIFLFNTASEVATQEIHSDLIQKNNDDVYDLSPIISYMRSIDHENRKVIIDASALDKNILLELLFVLEHIIENVNVKVYYVTPEKYGLYEFENYKDPVIIPFAPGIQTFGKNDVLIMISGYEGEGMLAIMRYLEPTSIHMGKVIPPSEDNFDERNIKIAANVIEEYSSEEQITYKTFNIPGNDIESAVQELERYADDNNLFNQNIFVAPMSNKITSMAAYMFWKSHPEIQLVYIRGELIDNDIKDIGKKSGYIFA